MSRNTKPAVSRLSHWACVLSVFMAGLPQIAASTEAAASPSPPTQVAIDPAVKVPLDRSRRTRYGKASFYAKYFAGRTMADGTAMNPESSNAASRTLPLGTIARVTNLQTGQSAVVTIKDRGPYVVGRIVDLSPSTARSIGITSKNGVADVAVAPIVVPLPGASRHAGSRVAFDARNAGPTVDQ